jgi:septum site-determining protein MinD
VGELLELAGKQNIRLIVNRVRPKMIASMELTVDDVMDDAGLPLLGVVPEDENVTLAAAFGKPLLHYSRRGGAAQACRRIAKRIQGMHVPLPNK